jgi:riboflavin kinase/FMN adenylyltransferase
MEIISSLENIKPENQSIITVGTFDGFHRGHQALLNRMLDIRNQSNLNTTVVTFEPHPRKVITGCPVPILTSKQEKLSIFSENKIDRVVVIPFTKEFATKSSVEFVESILVEKFGMRYMVIGYDHHFGHNREGGIEELQKLGKKLSFIAEKVEPYEFEGKIVSSSMIRQLVSNGEIEQAGKLLGRHYRLFAKVITGAGRGKSLGFPTANLEPDDPDKLIPARGVYAVDVVLGNETYKGMMNIGNRPTFDYEHLTLEVHLFNFRGLIYGETLEVKFKKFIRKERKFSSKEELIHQLKIDQEISEKT